MARQGIRRLATLYQAITVVGTSGFHARPIHQHAFSFSVAVDSAAGGLVVTNAALGAFTFAGSVRVDGASPFARGPENPGYPDSAVFESDGRNELLVADSGARGPIRVEPRGIAGANAGRLYLSATGWPANRVLLVTIDPLDLYVTDSRRGFGERDSMRIDTDHSVAYLTDAAASPAVIAVALGRGAHGRLQTGQTSIVLERDYGGEVGRERRAVNKLLLIVEPDRAADGTMHAEIDFGLGRSELEALQAATAEDPGIPPQPRLVALTTPNDEVSLALLHLAAATAWFDAPPAVTPDTSVLSGLDLWRQIQARAHEAVGGYYGRTDAPAAELASLEYMIVRQLFGVRDEEGQIGIAPHLDGADDNFTWRLGGYRAGDDSLSIVYRPADHRIAINVGALHRVRLHLALPWLTPTSCVSSQRGAGVPDYPSLVQLSDGTYYVDLRAAWDPANVTISAGSCAGGTGGS